MGRVAVLIVWVAWAAGCSGSHDTVDVEPGAGGAGAGGDAAEAGVGGDAGSHGGSPSVPGPPTKVSRLPAKPFVIEAIEDPGHNCPLDALGPCTAGPWLLGLRALPDGSLEGALASLDAGRPVHEAPEVWPIRLEPTGNGNFRPAAPDGGTSDYSVTLKNYDFGYARAPGMCLVGTGSNVLGVESGSDFSFYDDTADGVADRVVLSGWFATQGQRGGDYELTCHTDLELETLATRGSVTDSPPALQARGDALRPMLQLSGGFLASGSAQLQLDSGELVDAEALEAGGLIYGFGARATLVPSSQVTWRVDVDEAESFGRALTEAELPIEVEAWPVLKDGGFEDLDSGQWPDSNGWIAESLEYHSGTIAALPAISGNRSFTIKGDQGARFRIVRPAGASHLRFLAIGTPRIDVGSVGRVGGPDAKPRLSGVSADCQTYAEICDIAGPDELKEYSLELGSGQADLLVAVHDAQDSFGSTQRPFWLDDLRADVAEAPAAAPGWR